MAKRKKQITIKGFDKIIRPREEHESRDEYWTCEWVIFHAQSKKKESFEVGAFKFLGKPENGRLELQIEIHEDFRNRGYGADALKAISDWCFAREEIIVIDAHIDGENRAALRAFTDAGFIYRSKEHGIEHYSIVKPESTWLGLYIVIGVWAGLMLGVVTSNPVIGFCIGLFIALVCGKIMEIKAKKKREEFLGTIFGDK